MGGIALHIDGDAIVSGRDISHVHDGNSRAVWTTDAARGFDPAARPVQDRDSGGRS